VDGVVVGACRCLCGEHGEHGYTAHLNDPLRRIGDGGLAHPELVARVRAHLGVPVPAPPAAPRAFSRLRPLTAMPLGWAPLRADTEVCRAVFEVSLGCAEPHC